MGYIGQAPNTAILTAADITDGIIANADIASDAAIALSKTALSAGTGITLSTNTLNLDGAQTGITSAYNASPKMGRDSQNLIDFATTDNKIILRVNNVDEVELVENALSPVTNDGVALGTTALGWSDLHIASAGVINWVNGEMTITETNANLLTVAGGNLAGTFVGDITGAVTGNADTATALATTRAINGVNFDGSAAITVTAAAGTLSGDTLKSTVLTSSLTTVGALGSGSIGTGFGTINNVYYIKILLS